MKATLETINQMQADGVIGRYAIGGAVGALRRELDPHVSVPHGLMAQEIQFVEGAVE